MEDKKFTPLELWLSLALIAVVLVSLGWLSFKGWKIYQTKKQENKRVVSESFQKHIQPFLYSLREDLKAASQVQGGENGCTLKIKGQTFSYKLVTDDKVQGRVFRVKNGSGNASLALAEGISYFKLDNRQGVWQLSLEGRETFLGISEYLALTYNFSSQESSNIQIKPADISLPNLDKRASPLF
jgi:hypothetical protein